MCFSASVSSAASALLIPAGVYCIKSVMSEKAYLPLAGVPLAFGIQQGCEGLVWLGMNSDDASLTQAAALAFLFFSYWFWLVWPSVLVVWLEENPNVQRLCQVFLALGIIYGTVLYLPLLINSDWLSIAVVQHSIEYQAQFVGDAIPRLISRLLYASIILGPLFLSSRVDIKIWGILIAILASITALLFNYAFVSVWCFFAALVSMYVVQIIVNVTPTWSEQTMGAKS
jgi:hypothetical protein